MKTYWYKFLPLTFVFLFCVFNKVFAQDAGITAVLSPADGSCGSAKGIVKVIVYNYGSSSISSIPVQLKVSGSATFSLLDTLKKTIGKGGQDTLTFKNTINTQAGGTFTFNVYTILAGDVNSGNDALSTTITIYATPDAPVGTGATLCGSGTVVLKAPSTSKGSVTKWYRSIISGTSFASGDSITPTLNTTTTFYASSVFGNGSDSLETNYKGSNNYLGIMFKVKPLVDMNILAFDVNPISTAKDSIFFYYKAGDFGKYTTTPSAWTFGGKDAFSPKGSGGPNKVNIGGNVALQAGKEYSFYIYVLGAKKSYLYQTAYKADDSDYNSSLIIHYGNGQSSTFGGSSSPYYDQFNGGIYYATNSCGSARIAVTGTIKEVVKSLSLSQNKTSKGAMNAGTSKNPDEICVGDSIKYDLSNPSNFSNSDYGTKWKMRWSLKSSKGVPTNNFSFVTPSASSNGLISFYPSSNNADSVFTLTIVATNSGTGCDTVITRLIHVNGAVTAGFTVSNVCYGHALSLVNSSTPTGKINYIWDFGNGDTASATAPKYKYPATGNYTINLSAYNAACKNTTSHNVTIYNAPYGLNIVKGTPFRGQYNDGDVVNPDNICLGDTNVYQLTPPKGLSNSDYGTKWIITGITFKTPFGSTTKDTAVKLPTVIKNGTFSFFPTKYADSIYILSVSVRTMPGNCDSVATRYVHVRVKPVAYFSFTNACFGSPLSFKDSSTVLISSISTWAWDFGDGSTGNSPKPSHSYTKAGVYKVSVTASTDVGCAASVNHNVEQYPRPAAKYGQVLLCNGSTNTFSDSSIIATGKINSWKWSFGDGSTSVTENTTHIYSKSGPYNVKLVTTSSFGCKDSVTKKLTIMPNPVSDFGFKNVCAGTQMYFVNKAIDSLSPTTYLWDFGDGNTSAALQPNHIFAKNGTYQVSLKVTSKTGCSDVFSQPIKPYPKPVPAFGTGTACSGLPVSFKDTSNAGTGASYTWNYDDGSNETLPKNTASHSFAKPGTYKVMLQILTADGCSDTVSKSVTVFEIPKADFSVTDVCLGATMSFSNTSTGAGSLSYAWDFGDHSKPVIAKDVQHKYGSAASYSARLWVTNDGGCIDSILKTVKVNPLPSTPVWTSTRKGYQVSFVPNDTTLASYKWFFGTANNDSSQKKKPVFVYPSIDAKYRVILVVTNGNGCSSAFSDSVRVSSSGINDPVSLADGMLIYPNPFGDRAAISYHLNAPGNLSVQVYDMQGRKLATLREGIVAPGDYQDIFDANKYDAGAGMYLIKIIVNNQYYTARMVKM
jgi:PKD repeat protein